MSTNPTLPKWLKLVNRLMIALNRLGMSFGTWYILSIRGRKTGKMRSTPVSVLHVNGQRYVVTGFETQWVKNARKDELTCGMLFLERPVRKRLSRIEPRERNALCPAREHNNTTHHGTVRIDIA